MRVALHFQKKYSFNKAPLKKIFQVIGRLVPRYRDREVSVALVDNLTIKRLNKRYRHRDAVTDVLSFAFKEEAGFPSPASRYLGEIIIAYPRARQQAKANKHSVQHEVVTLLVHGFLHLAGFDHQTDSQSRRMDRHADKIWRVFMKEAK